MKIILKDEAKNFALKTAKKNIGRKWLKEQAKEGDVAVKMESTNKDLANLICPHCGYAGEIEIPKDRCLVFLKCEKCQKLIRTPEGECCVVCAYSNKKCRVSKNNSC